MSQNIWEKTREEIIGRDSYIQTPFGRRVLTYADYTASGRGVYFIENYLIQQLKLYGNTHTSDDATGKFTTQRLHQAEKKIKKFLNAGEEYKIISVGNGTTGAIHRLQQILGVYVPPAAWKRFNNLFEDYLKPNEFSSFQKFMGQKRPVVFVGPYEHHSNEVTWRECFAEVVEVNLDKKGFLDLKDLEEKLSSPAYEGREKIGAFSAASNVTGLKTPVYEVAKILHRHGALAFFDFAACAPYVSIDVHKDEESYLDGVYFSPHKFLGGPGSSGILVIHEKIYPNTLPPTCGGGGTVKFVTPLDQEYLSDIEMREKPGTPGILQLMKASLAMELKEVLGVDRIEKKEAEFIQRVFNHFKEKKEVHIIGPQDPSQRIPIFSFNLKVDSCFLHPRFVVRLLNDLFGIQARAGCSCAGPYGQKLLGISREKAEELRDLVAMGKEGLRPGWVRVNFHYLLGEEEFEYILQSIDFLAEKGKYFLPWYRFNMETGEWIHKKEPGDEVNFGMEEALEREKGELCGRKEESREQSYKKYMDEAEKKAKELEKTFCEEKFKVEGRKFIPFIHYET
ncbi:MAG: aminotransferase class V-fold PLP-dependent enzyme [Bacteroidales bacterium]|nr:aminotransferase class V-fold PLP-dependent enzyme [Bacteroidales bacterium]